MKPRIRTEFNIEGYPEDRFLELVERVRPAQATLVPDGPHVLTSNAGWDTVAHARFLSGVITKIKSWGVRVSLFVNPDLAMVTGARLAGADRIELYTEPYARGYPENPSEAVAAYVAAAAHAHDLQLGINAGHDLDLHNLSFLKQSIPYLDEVSIGHALICDALYLGLENTIQLYLRQLE